MAEGPVDEALVAEQADQRPEQARRDLRHQLLHAQHPAELPLVRVVELGVAGRRRLAVLPAVDDAAQLAAQGDAEVERGADALGAERQAVPGRVAGEEDAALGALAQLVGDPVALVADPVGVEVFGQQLGRLAHVEARVEGADADAQLVAGGEAPAVAGGHVAAVDPDLEVLAAALGVDLEAARERRVGRLVAVAVGQHAAPAERVDDERGGDHAAVGVDRDRAVAVGRGRPAVHLGGLEAGVAVAPEQLAELAVVEGGEGEGEAVAGVAVRGVHQQRVEALALGVHQAQRFHPHGGDAAGRGLALADLVAIDDQHVGARIRPARGRPRDRRSWRRRSARHGCRRAESAPRRVWSLGSARRREYPPAIIPRCVRDRYDLDPCS